MHWMLPPFHTRNGCRWVWHCKQRAMTAPFGRAGVVTTAAIIPESWDYDTFGEWTGIPQYIGQEYFDSVNKIWYKAGGISAVSDWIRISNA